MADIDITQEVPLPAERPPASLVQAESEEILRRDVRIDGTQLRIEHDDSGRERIEQTRGIEVRQR